MRLMLAIDIGEQNPVRLLNEGVLWAQRLGGKLDLAHVSRNPLELVAGAAPEIQLLFDQELARTRDSDRARLDELLAQVPSDYRGTIHQLTGSPVEALVQASRSHTLLLLGTHGRQGLSRMWLGSVTEQVVRLAQCPVLVLRLYTE